MGEQPSHGSLVSEHFTKANRSQLQRWVTKARVLTMDNVRTDCSYLALSPSHDSKCFTLHKVNFKCKSHCFFLWLQQQQGLGIFAAAHMTSMLMREPLPYLLATNAITLGWPEKPKVLKWSKWWADGSVGFCISHLLYSFKKRVKEVSSICI